LLIGLGFRPLEAAKLALIGNTAPVAFGALGTPLITLAKITDIDLQLLSSMVGRQLPVFSLIVPFWLIAAQAGWRGMLAVWPACLVAGATFGISQFFVSNYIGPTLVDIISALVSMGSLVLLMKFWQPKDTQENAVSDEQRSAHTAPAGSPVWKAWLPWVFLSVFVFLWGLPTIKTALNGVFAPTFETPLLHKAVLRVPPVVAHPEPESAIFNFNALSATGTALLFAGVLAGLVLGLKPGRILRLYGQTIWKVRVSLLTIALMLALGFTTRYSGTDTTMGLLMAGTGWWFPFFSPLIGWLGVALTAVIHRPTCC